MKLCTVEGCEKVLAAQGLCHMHRNRVRRHGTTEIPFPRKRKPPKPLVHGTQRAYQNWCRCDVCVQAARERAKAYHHRYKATIAEKRLMKEYGLTRAQYDAMLEAQGGVCAICGAERTPGKPLFVDHCHTTGVVRGILCTKCNTGIGMFDDDPDRLMATAAYLLQHTDVLGGIA